MLPSAFPGDGHWRLAFLLLWIAGVSDGLDGLIARWLKQQTTLGQYLDPVADKALLSTLFLVLMHVGVIPRYVTVLVFSRDLGILLISALLYVTNTLRDFRPSSLGKFNTLLQILGVLVVMTVQVLPRWARLVREHGVSSARLMGLDNKLPNGLNMRPRRREEEEVVGENVQR